jgi:hypothetical protein
VGVKTKPNRSDGMSTMGNQMVNKETNGKVFNVMATVGKLEQAEWGIRSDIRYERQE